MKLYIKQKVFSVGDKYNIYDENENLVFRVESELLTFTPKMHIYDASDREVFFIHKKFTFMLAEYEIFKDSDLYATISQEFAFFKAKLNIKSSYGVFDVDGDFFGMDYEVSCDGEYFGSVQKKYLSWADSYELDVPNSQNVPLFCTLVIAIDNCLHSSC